MTSKAEFIWTSDDYGISFDVTKHDALEVNGCVESDGIVEVDFDNPEFFSVYAHLISGGVECMHDFASKAEAREYAATLAKQHSVPVADFTAA